MIDDEYSGHVELTAGITPEQILAGWVDHETHGYPDI